MSKRPKRRLYAKLNSFGWREGWQNVVVFYGLFFMVMLSLLITLVAPLLFDQRHPWIERDRLTGTIIGFTDQETETCAPGEPLIELDGGGVVRACNSAPVGLETGFRVVVQEYIQESFDRRKYRIISLGEPDEAPN